MDVTVYYLRDDGSKRGTFGYLGTGFIRAAAPDLSLTAAPALLRSGSATKVTWQARHVYSCTVTGDGLSLNGKTGSRDVLNITQMTTFVLTCQTPIGPLTKTAIVNVLAAWEEQ